MEHIIAVTCVPLAVPVIGKTLLTVSTHWTVFQHKKASAFR